ncbi:MAG: zinc-binding dehydrogenase [Rhizobiaceae bacterium]|nr:zinc-binding dehydrogenase [Rhizobiaceae bacterium]
MKAIVFPSRDTVTLVDLPDPEAGPGQVVIEVRASGLCHTDFEVLHANYGPGAFPVVPGHEYAGVIAAIGPGVTGLSIGDRVVVDPNIECGACPACKRGWAHLCDRLEAYGVTRNGGFAERSAVSADAVHKIGDMAFEVAALAEPMGCVLNGLEAARARDKQNALIFGAGPMGLMLAVGLRAEGVENLTLADLDEARLAYAEEMGFAAIRARSDDMKPWHQAADLAIDATGVPDVASSLIRHTCNGGTALFFGVCPQAARIEIAPFDVFRRQLSLVGSHSLNHNIPAALEALRAFDGDLSRLVSHRLALDDMQAVFTEGPPRGCLKVQATAAPHPG